MELVSLNATPQNLGSIINDYVAPDTGYYEYSAAPTTTKAFSTMLSALTSLFSKLFRPITTRLAARNSALYEYGLTSANYKKQRKWEKAWYKRLPPARGPESSPFEDQYGVSLQLQSNFLSKLPLEVRQMIYELALSGETFHIEVLNKSYQKGENSTFRLRARRNAVDIFGLARACKQAYIEATPYIYKHNTFQIRDTTSFFTFIRVTPSQLLHAIRKLALQWKFSLTPDWYNWHRDYGVDNGTFWRPICKIINEMQGLRDVGLDISAFFRVRPMHEEFLFTYVEMLRREGRKVRVQTNWKENEETAQTGRQWDFGLARGVL